MRVRREHACEHRRYSKAHVGHAVCGEREQRGDEGFKNGGGELGGEVVA